MSASSKQKSKSRSSQLASSQMSPCQSQDDLDVTLSKKELERKANHVVRYLLFSDRKKMAFKRADLVKNVFKEHSKMFSKIMATVAEMLDEVFGFELVEMENEDGKSKGYILVNKLEGNIDTREFDSEEDNKMALLLIILSLIFMNEGMITETALWNTLHKFGIYKEKHHDVYGNVDKLINTEFVKENYLGRKKIEGHEGSTFQYNFGSRALKEISKRKVLEFVSEVYGIESIREWKIPYQEVVDSENRLTGS